MDRLLEKLKVYGADIDGTMGRFLDDVDLYKTCFDNFLQDEAFVQLKKSLEINDYDGAFEYAHTLKGITGNMGLTPLYHEICCIVEALRSKDYRNLNTYYAEIEVHLQKLNALK